MRFPRVLFGSMFAAFGILGQAQAGLVSVQLNSLTGVGSGPSYGAAYQGTMQWSYISGTTATVTVQLANTSSVASNLAAFVVGLADTSMAVTQVSAPTNFGQITGNALKATPFGDYDWGSASTGSFNGGGNTIGLAQGQSGTWVFTVTSTASKLAAVTDASVFNGSNAWDFVVHVKGIQSGNKTVSEKLSSTLVPIAVPAPCGAAVLLTTGLSRARRRRAA